MLFRSLRGAAAVATAGGRVTTHIEGTFGVVEAEAAQALATVLAELVTNAAAPRSTETKTSSKSTVSSTF